MRAKANCRPAAGGHCSSLHAAGMLQGCLLHFPACFQPWGARSPRYPLPWSPLYPQRVIPGGSAHQEHPSDGTQPLLAPSTTSPSLAQSPRILTRFLCTTLTPPLQSEGETGVLPNMYLNIDCVRIYLQISATQTRG